MKRNTANTALRKPCILCIAGHNTKAINLLCLSLSFELNFFIMHQEGKRARTPQKTISQPPPEDLIVGWKVLLIPRPFPPIPTRHPKATSRRSEFFLHLRSDPSSVRCGPIMFTSKVVAVLEQKQKYRESKCGEQHSLKFAVCFRPPC